MSASSKKATAPKTKKAAAPAKSVPAHPPWTDMIKECIAANPDDARHGVSRPQIKKFVEEKYGLEIKASQITQLSKAIANGEGKGIFVLPKGPSGRVRLAPKNAKTSDASDAKEVRRRWLFFVSFFINKPAAKSVKAPAKGAAIKPKMKADTAKAKPAAKKPASKTAKKPVATPKATTTKKASVPKKEMAAPKEPAVAAKKTAPPAKKTYAGRKKAPTTEKKAATASRRGAAKKSGRKA
ncbi:hypothetical protein K488DRAFT_79030 [Vararia minispora EC-137]|uniref:Uncharacterized protein n=1 Tax=Vararia minispora EC-137 TaxID=1314806 RepID=A0ACB8QIK4_9AGAM|nr:hypothetical protein K488DRAFT_79030 [Vararia minispora EC-137]